MFLGSINSGLRSMMREFVEDWKDKPVYVGCSGNFTIERLLVEVGIEEIHGCDVSIYSCYIGEYLAGGHPVLKVTDPAFEWLIPYLDSGIPTIATLSLCSEMLKFVDRTEPYFTRMYQAYRDQWPELHRQTVEKFEKILEKVKLKSYFSGDVMQWLETVPDDAVFMCAPPTWKGDYEKLYARMVSVFDWEPPEYDLFEEDTFDVLAQRLIEKQAEWVLVRYMEVPELAPYMVGNVQTGQRNRRSSFIYRSSSNGPGRLVTPKRSIETVPGPRRYDLVRGPLSLAYLTSGQVNLLRAEYLAAAIATSDGAVALGILDDGALVGALVFTLARYPWADAYMLSDSPVRPSVHKRLSKLVLAVAVSTEVQAVLEQTFKCKVDSIATTAFTENSVSMKYRGLFTLHNRSGNMLNYRTKAGIWSLEGGLDWWMKKHAKALND